MPACFGTRDARLPMGAARRLAAGWLVFVGISLVALPVRANASSPQLIVLRDNPGELAALAEEIDRQLLLTLGHEAGFAAELSPTPFAEVALMADCGERSPAGCAVAISHALDTEWLLIRQLKREDNGSLQLSLTAHDGPDAIISRRTAVTLPDSGALDLPRLLALMVAQLYAPLTRTGTTEPPAAAPAVPTAPAPTKRRLDPRAVIGWSSVGVGGALLATGLILGGLSRHDERAYSRLRIDDIDDARRAHALIAQAEKRADFANGFFVASAATALLGAGLLLWKGVGERREASSLQVAALPALGGTSFLVRGAWSGGHL